jgi:hypothetical protein
MSKEIPLTHGTVALVDDADYGFLMQWKWRLDNNGYAARTDYTGGKQRTILMHRVIVNAPEVDHRDTNRLNNQRSNLRAATRSQNTQNSRKAPGKSSQYKGVTWNKKLRKWNAQINTGRHLIGKIHLGTFEIEAEAAKAYDEAARRYYGEYARPNFD